MLHLVRLLVLTALPMVKRDTGTGRSWWDIFADLNGFTVELLITGML